MILPRHLRAMACGAVVAAAACSDSEAPPTDDHTPATYTVLVDSVPTAPPFTLTQGQTVRMQLKFVNAAGDDLDDVESSHFGGLTFSPAELATVTRDANHNFRFSIAGGTPGAGTLEVRYGHDVMADEKSFAPVTVTVVAGP